MSSKRALFPSYFLAGFECATHVNRRGAREDMVRRTQHDRFVDEDYARLLAVGIRGVRESVPWYRIQREDRLDFRPAEPFVTAGMRHEMTQIWDLFPSNPELRRQSFDSGVR